MDYIRVNPNPSPIGNKFGLFLFGPSIWKTICTFHSEKTENSYSNLGILLLCPT